MSINLPDQAKQAIKYLHIDHLSNLDSISLIAQSLNGNELSLYLIEETNKFLQKRFDTEIALFYISKQLPISIPLTSVYDISQIASCHGKIVATDLLSWQSALLAPTNKKYFYVYDTARLLDIPPNLVNEINNSKFTLICRNADSLQALKKIGLINFSSKYMEYFSIIKLMEIINGQFNNA